jgi:hypothetical protein
MKPNKTWVVRPATTKMLASLYGVSRGIISKHIKSLITKIGPKIGNYWMVNQVIIITKSFGPPPDIEVIYPDNEK